MGGFTFRPEDVGPIVRPEDLPAEAANEVFGDLFMEYYNRLREQPFVRGRYKITSVDGPGEKK